MKDSILSAVFRLQIKLELDVWEVDVWLVILAPIYMLVFGTHMCVTYLVFHYTAEA